MAEVLVTVHGMDDRPGAQEEKGFEEGVGDHVEDGRRVGAAADR